MKLTLEALEVLDAIDLRGSFAAAAEALHRVPSSVTHSVHRLEEDLGIALFQREGRKAVLTTAGRSLLEEGRLLLRAATALENRMQDAAQGWETELSIAVEGVIDMTRLLPLIAEFDRENSGTRIRLTHEILGGCWDALLSGRAAIAIGAPGDPPPGGGFARQSMGQVRFVFAVAPHHPLAHMPEPISLKELRRHRMAVASDTSRELMARSSGVIFGQPTIAVPNLQTKLAAQEAGLGVGHLPITIAQAAQAAGRLLIKQTEEMDTPETIYTAWRADHEGMAFNWFREKLCSPTWRELLHPEH